jgi:hypothetical protein
MAASSMPSATKRSASVIPASIAAATR